MLASAFEEILSAFGLSFEDYPPRPQSQSCCKRLWFTRRYGRHSVLKQAGCREASRSHYGHSGGCHISGPKRLSKRNVLSHLCQCFHGIVRGSQYHRRVGCALSLHVTLVTSPLCASTLWSCISSSLGARVDPSEPAVCPLHIGKKWMPCARRIATASARVYYHHHPAGTSMLLDTQVL